MAECSVCFYPLSTAETVVFECSHYFHRECTAYWLREHKNCPICRKPVASQYSEHRVVYGGDGQEICYFYMQEACVAIAHPGYLRVRNILLYLREDVPDAFAVAPGYFAAVYNQCLRIWSHLRVTEVELPQCLYNSGRQLPVGFRDLAISGDCLRCVSPVQLLIMLIPTRKIIFQLRFDRPLIWSRHPFYLFLDGLYVLDDDTLCAYRRIPAARCYKFDYCANLFLLAYLNGSVHLTDQDGNVVVKLDIGPLKSLCVTEAGFCLLQEGVLKVYGAAGEIRHQLTGVTHLEKSDAGRVRYSCGGSIFELDFLE